MVLKNLQSYKQIIKRATNFANPKYKNKMYKPNMCIDSSALKFWLNEETTKIYCIGGTVLDIRYAHSSKLKSQFCRFQTIYVIKSKIGLSKIIIGK